MPSRLGIEDRYEPTFWEMLSLSAGLLRSFKPATTRHHFMTGAQKKTVFGPAMPNHAVVRDASGSLVSACARIAATVETHRQDGS